MATIFNEDGTVTISKEIYDSFVKARRELRTLEAYGVDNWDGYGQAMSKLYPEEEDEEDED